MDTIQLEREREIVRNVEQVIKDAGPFVSLAEAARITGVPLPTLADAVRNGRVPALRVQSQRWLVRVSAVRSYFAHTEINPHLELQRQLIAEGLLDDVRLEQRFEPFEPIPVKGRPASEILIEERR
jgi:excisionase family DNA binding protein